MSKKFPPASTKVSKILAASACGAREGLGLAYAADLTVAEDLARGTLATALDRYAPTGPGFFLYFPARAQTQAKLRAFIDTALAVLAPEGRRARARR
ncbi:uncharacterized protein SOCE26_010730 [Sorangium cellulosum]|uniref:LysR substrate-binding domain-containing protein n=1 Tax=Sorangium cellulosum TaxID=56 RepID=A0A2L0EK82_SORCE|nr:LysR substrate-binding domain-containing protein [Sorangium cellulosum]AUX39678.1 uncharacterized protein SOCE26_010730 [Sorangium cellulosum]